MRHEKGFSVMEMKQINDDTLQGAIEKLIDRMDREENAEKFGSIKAVYKALRDFVDISYGLLLTRITIGHKNFTEDLFNLVAKLLPSMYLELSQKEQLSIAHTISHNSKTHAKQKKKEELESIIVETSKKLPPETKATIYALGKKLHDINPDISVDSFRQKLIVGGPHYSEVVYNAVKRFLPEGYCDSGLSRLYLEHAARGVAMDGIIMEAAAKLPDEFKATISALGKKLHDIDPRIGTQTVYNKFAKQRLRPDLFAALEKYLIKPQPSPVCCELKAASR